MEPFSDFSGFAPAWLLASPHAQTIWPALFRRAPSPPTSAKVWETPDGDVLDVDLLTNRPGQPAVMVLHGLEGSSRAPYVRGLLAAISGQGWNGMAVNFRSCGPTKPRGPRLYHSGETRDLPFLLDRAAHHWPKSRIAAVGFSMGGNALLKWLGEQGTQAPLCAAVAVSVPFDLATCAATLDKAGFWPGVYRARFLRTLRRKALRIASARADLLDAAAIRRCRTFAAFDEHVTAPLNGFAGAADYWARCSSAAFLPQVRRPTLLISSEDDPFVPATAIPHAAIATNPALSAWITPTGGHVGFVAGSAWRPRYALEAVTLRFLRSHLDGDQSQ